tara:strand:+ start:1088 stop:1231 length:144 start_codon:yes stop_codon:yes gene_type:complete
MEYNEYEELDVETLKLLDKVCEGIEVPSDEESVEAAIAHDEVIDEEK